MGGGGLIVRFIDIVMILLFGFICSSELHQTAKIKLAKTVELPPSNPDPEMVVYVGVTTDGFYMFEHDKYATRDLNVLEVYLRGKKEWLAESRYKMRVRLRANYDTPIRFMMKAAEVCDRIDVLKTFDVRIASKVKT